MAFVPAPGYQPTYNPTLPYNQPIPGGLSIGMSIYIQGVADEKMKRFQVNFAVGQDPGADIAFHFNPRFDGWDKVVFNSQQGGRWGNEERKRSMPFSKGAPFELVFMIMAEHYKVVVNGNPFYEFGHRLPLQMVTHLQVNGDLHLQSINFLGGQFTPNQAGTSSSGQDPRGEARAEGRGQGKGHTGDLREKRKDLVTGSQRNSFLEEKPLRSILWSGGWPSQPSHVAGSAADTVSLEKSWRASERWHTTLRWPRDGTR
ncbi:Hypothetical predicted protein [Marmota monax]|uniref:Galectin n=1 Tax=Marmota monax TaxID=9995 RepID=A0A5E4AGW1_MARMO|nr:hypothetical protein GHT09_016117 [Marmota monax]VTJ56210.1 Hypothetical predicted protein [Marmota monax]